MSTTNTTGRLQIQKSDPPLPHHDEDDPAGKLLLFRTLEPPENMFFRNLKNPQKISSALICWRIPLYRGTERRVEL